MNDLIYRTLLVWQPTKTRYVTCRLEKKLKRLLNTDSPSYPIGNLISEDVSGVSSSENQAQPRITIFGEVNITDVQKQLLGKGPKFIPTGQLDETTGEEFPLLILPMNFAGRNTTTKKNYT